MKVEKQKLYQIIETVLEGCGDPVASDPEGLAGVADAIVSSVSPMVVGEGGKAQMARRHLYHISNRAQSLHDRLTDDDELPEWVQSKLAVTEAMVNAVFDYLDYKLQKHKKDMM